MASLEELADAEMELLVAIPGIDAAGAETVKARARELAVEKAKKAREAAAAAAAAPGEGGPTGA